MSSEFFVNFVNNGLSPADVLGDGPLLKQVLAGLAGSDGGIARELVKELTNNPRNTEIDSILEKFIPLLQERNISGALLNYIPDWVRTLQPEMLAKVRDGADKKRKTEFTKWWDIIAVMSNDVLFNNLRESYDKYPDVFKALKKRMKRQ